MNRPKDKGEIMSEHTIEVVLPDVKLVCKNPNQTVFTTNVNPVPSSMNGIDPFDILTCDVTYGEPRPII